MKVDRDHYPGHDLLWQPDEQHVVCGRHEWPNGGLHPRRGYSRSLWGELLQEYRSCRKEGRMTDLKWCRKGFLLFQRQERSWAQHPHGGDNLVRPRFNCFYSATAVPLLIANNIMCSWSDKHGVPRIGMDTFHVIIWAALFVLSKIVKIYKTSLSLFESGTRPKVDWFIP